MKRFFRRILNFILRRPPVGSEAYKDRVYFVYSILQCVHESLLQPEDEVYRSAPAVHEGSRRVSFLLEHEYDCGVCDGAHLLTETFEFDYVRLYNMGADMIVKTFQKRQLRAVARLKAKINEVRCQGGVE